MENEVLTFIKNNIGKTVKAPQKANGTMLDTPYPFITPCLNEDFQEMYYWDTYFANKAFLCQNKRENVFDVLRNFDYFVKHYGKIPNGNRTFYLNRSQPPFFGLMIADLLKTGDGELNEAEAFDMLENEYRFWTSARQSENGLNFYSCDLSDEQCLADFGEIGTSVYEQRVGIVFERTADNCRSVIAECESGWDFSPRFPNGCLYYNPVDLNCLLYADEVLLSRWAQTEEKKKFYGELADRRKQRMNATMLASDGIYYDYDYKTKTRSTLISCASFFPFFVGLSNDKRAYAHILSKSERAFGVVAALTDKRVFQWAEPNGWACLAYIAVAAAQAIGLSDDAARLAKKYLTVVENNFKITGRLWEKYNVETGGLDVVGEYGQTEMLGWTAGVYVALHEYLETGRLV